MLERFFRLSENQTSARIELLAGVTTFLTMAYIIFVQPSVLSGAMFGKPTGMDFGAVTTATCFSAVPAAAAAGFPNPWSVALGTVFISGVLFLILSLAGLRELIFNAVSPSLKSGIAAGIGLFIAFIGLQQAGVIVKDPGTAVKLNSHFASQDVIVFFV